MTIGPVQDITVADAMAVADGFGNVVAGLGNGRDKASSGTYTAKILDPTELIAAYETAFLPKRIVDTIAEDATRRWRTWNATKEQITAIEAEEARLRVLQGTETVLKNARLLGGAALYIPVRGQQSHLPLDPKTVGKGDLRPFVPFSQLQLSEGELDDNLDSDNFGLPKSYTLNLNSGRQVEIHHSRIIRHTGDENLLDQPRQSSTWGRSVLSSMLDATMYVDGAVNAIVNLIFEAKIDVIAIQGLMQKLQQDPKYEQVLLKRFSMASAGKSINGTLILDSLETFQQKSQTYGSLPEIMDRLFQYVSGACSIPVTRLFGTSPGGLNATGEADIRHYYDRVQTLQNNKITPAMSLADECIIRSALGTRPKKIFYTWRSLWQVTENDRAEIGQKLALAAEKMVKNGMIDPYSMGEGLVTAFGEYDIMPGIEDAWTMHQTVRSKPVEALDLNKQTTIGFNSGTKKEDEPSPAPANKNQDPNKKAVNDERPLRRLYVRRDVLNGQDIIDWAKGQGLTSVYPASEMHVTIMYTTNDVDRMAMGEAWFQNEAGTLTIVPGGPRDVDIFGTSSLVIRFSNSDLRWRHIEMKERGAETTHPDYKPHITVTNNIEGINLENIEPYSGKIELGPEIFEDIVEDWSESVEEITP